MNVTISVCGSFPGAYHYGRYLEEGGRLTRLINPLPFGRSDPSPVSIERLARTMQPIRELIPTEMSAHAQRPKVRKTSLLQEYVTSLSQ